LCEGEWRNESCVREKEKRKRGVVGWRVKEKEKREVVMVTGS
jgi:hypothetical protein